MMDAATPPAAADRDAAHVADQCFGYAVRSASRVVTRAYDAALRPVGLRLTQFGLLVAIAMNQGTSIAALSSALTIEASAVGRNLGPLQRAGLVQWTGAGGRAGKHLMLTDEGRARLRIALGAWDRVQDAFRRVLGDGKGHAVRAELRRLEAAARTAEQHFAQIPE